MSGTTLVFDDDCGFCTWWAEAFADHSSVAIVGFSEMDDQLRDRLPPDYEECAHLVTEEAVYSCGEAIEEAFLRSEVGEPARPISERLRRSTAYGSLRELGYRFVAENRDHFGKIVSKSE